MTAEQIAPWVASIGLLLTVGGISVAGVRSLTRLQARLDQLQATSATHLQITGLIVSYLQITPEQRAEMMRHFAQLGVPAPPVNPFTPDEVRHYKFYVEKARKGEPFTPEEARDFEALANKYKQDYPNDSNVWPLIALAAFIVGLYLLGRREGPERREDVV